MATVTCHTHGCAKENEAVPDVPVTVTGEDGNETPEDAVICGVCGQPITDIQ